MERGSHGDLLASNGIYSSMWNQQQQSLNVEDDGGQEVGVANTSEQLSKL